MDLGEQGAQVAIVGRNAERGNERVRNIQRSSGKALFQEADALDRESLVWARDAIEQRYGPVTVLVNAAGGNKPDATLPPGANFSDLALNAWRDVFDLNLIGGVLLPCQVEGGGRVRDLCLEVDVRADGAGR